MPNARIWKLSLAAAIPKRLFDVVAGYVQSLTLVTKKHTFQAAAKIAGVDESRICAMMNDPKTPALSKKVLSRAARRRLRKIKGIEGRLAFIVDATIVRRRSSRAENVGKHHSGRGFVWGHKFINFVLLTTDGVVPLDSIPTYTKKYARENGLARLTEIEIVERWIYALPSTGWFSQAEIESSVFLFDSGYDAKPVQRAAKGIGSNFVMALKSSRTVAGTSVKDLFWRTRRWLKNQTIRLHVGSGKNKTRRMFSVRTVEKALLKGFGLITAVCSKAESRKGKPQKFLAASDLSMSPREILKWYALRWRVETWHREMKQGFGFVDCRARRFSAVESHVRFCLTAHLVQKEAGQPQLTSAQYELENVVRSIKSEINKYGSGENLRIRLAAALQAVAA
jgi:hypothetical protein